MIETSVAIALPRLGEAAACEPDDFARALRLPGSEVTCW